MANTAQTSVELPIPLERLCPEGERARVDVQALRWHLEASGLHLGRGQDPLQLKGGLANLNFLIDVDGQWAVLRIAPHGPLPPGAHDRAREHRVLSRLPDAYPLAPRSLHLCEDPSVLGAPFQILEFRAGRSVVGVDMTPMADIVAPGQVLTEAMIDLLAGLHAVDAESLGLEALGRPNGFISRGIAGWTKRGIAAAGTSGCLTLVGEIGAWLEARADRAPKNPPTLLHCDFKLDNIVFAHDSARPVALLDWDMCTRGEPLFDVATLLSYWTEPGDPDCMHRLAQMPTAAHGFPSRAEVLDNYIARTGRNRDGFAVLRVLGLLKLGVVFLQLHARWREGAMGENARANDFAALGEEILAFARDVASEKYV